MMKPVFVRPVIEVEREQLEAGLRSSDAFVLRRCQIILASAKGQRAPHIAGNLGCDDETVRRVIRAWNERGLDCLKEGSRIPHTVHPAFDADKAEELRAMLHRSPRDFGRPTSLWTLKLAAEVSFEQGLVPERISGETIRATLARLEIRWQRAKKWITSPDPEYARKKVPATD
jgi:transposase